VKGFCQRIVSLRYYFKFDDITFRVDVIRHQVLECIVKLDGFILHGLVIDEIRTEIDNFKSEVVACGVTFKVVNTAIEVVDAH
jgi:hypothetical protein